jgi:6-pyruvoyltetrahydropterin/6-carboxytetrahydropterin synthase
MQITKEFRFEAAHRLMNHPGACANLHGHSYKMEITVEGPIHSDGMVMDFGSLTKAVNVVLNESTDTHTAFDHSVILWAGDPLLQLLKNGADDSQIPAMRIIELTCQPTAELMAQVLAVLIQTEINKLGEHVQVVRIKLWETAKAFAVWQL